MLKNLNIISIFLQVFRFFCGPTCGLPWRIFLVHLKRMCILLLLDGPFCVCVLSLSGPHIVLDLCFPIDFLSGWSTHWWKLGIKVPAIILLLSISPLWPINTCFICLVKVKSLSRVWLFATLWTVAYQASPSIGFSRQEYWNGVPLPSPILRVSGGQKSLTCCSLWGHKK